MEAPMPAPLVTAMVLKLTIEASLPFFSRGRAARVLKNTLSKFRAMTFRIKPVSISDTRCRPPRPPTLLTSRSREPNSSPILAKVSFTCSSLVASQA